MGDVVTIENESVVKLDGLTLKMAGSSTRSLLVLKFHIPATVQLMFPALKTDRNLPTIDHPLPMLGRLVGLPRRRT